MLLHIRFIIFSQLCYISNSHAAWIDEDETREVSSKADGTAPRIVRQSPTHPSVTPPTSQKSTTSPQKSTSSAASQKAVSIKIDGSKEDTCHLSIPKVTASSSSETLTGLFIFHY